MQIGPDNIALLTQQSTREVREKVPPRMHMARLIRKTPHPDREKKWSVNLSHFLASLIWGKKASKH